MSVLLALVAFSALRDAKVDFECPATRASVLLRRLSDTAKLDLRAAPALQDDVLVIRAHGVSVAELMDRIAYAAAGRWRTNHGGQILEPFRDEENRREVTVVKFLADGVRGEIRSRLEAPEMHAEWTAEAANRLAAETETAMSPAGGSVSSNNKNIKALFGRAPISRAIVRILDQIGADELASHLGNERKVYSTNPTPAELPMSPVQDVLDRFLVEQTMFVEATKSFLSGRPTDGQHISMSGVERGNFQGGDRAKGIGKALVDVVGSYRKPRVSATLYVLDGAGHELNECWLSTSIAPPPLATFDAKADDSPIPPDHRTAELVELGAGSDVGASGTMTWSTTTAKGSKRLSLTTSVPLPAHPMSQALAAWVASPAINEPLGLGVGMLLSTSARRRNENLVADLDDRSFRDGLSTAATAVTPSAWLNSYALQTDHVVAESDGWLTVYPRDPEGARRARINRIGLGDLLADLRARHILTLNAISRFAQTQSEAAEPGGFDYEYMRAVCPGIAVGGYRSELWPMYRLFGALSPNQRKNLADGSPIPMAGLTPAAADALRRIVSEGVEDPVITDAAGKGVDAYSQGIVRLWPELLPDGVPAETFVGAKVDSQPAAYCLNERLGVATVETVADLARDRFVMSNAQLAGYGNKVAYDRFAPAHLSAYHFHIRFTPNIAIEEDLPDGDFSDLDPVRPLSDMPGDFRNAVDQEFDDLKAAFGQGFQPGQGSNPPPAR